MRGSDAKLFLVYSQYKSIQPYSISSVFSRSDCFGSEYFYSCMDVLLVEKEARIQAASFVDDIHNYVK